MNPIVAASSSNHTIYYLEGRDSFCMTCFEQELWDAHELPYKEKVKLLRRVLSNLGESQAELSQRIIHVAATCGISLRWSESDEALVEFLEKIKASVATDSEADSILNHRPEENQELVDEFKTEENRIRSVKKLVPFTYEIIRQNKIHKVLDLVVQAFSACSIELRGDLLKEELGKGIDCFTQVLSTQLCENERFLKGNPYEAVKYSFPYVSDMKHEYLICLSQLRVDDYSYVEARTLLKKVFQLRFNELVTVVVEPVLINTLTIRTLFAEVVFKRSPLCLASNFLSLISEGEFFDDPELSPLLQKIWKDLVGILCNTQTQIGSYVKKVNLYLQNWSANLLLQTSGSTRMRIMQQIKLEGGSLPPDERFSKDTPLWRHIGFNQTKEGIDHIFKLDWDFDTHVDRSFYPMRHRTEIINNGLSDELHELIYPALVVTKKNNFSSWWLKVLGYDFYAARSGQFMTLPDPTTITKRWPNVLKDPGAERVFREFSVIETRGSVSVERFIELFCEFDVVCSSDAEFVHDHQYHMMTTLDVILNSTSEEYLDSINTARSKLKHAQRRIKEERHSVDETMLKALEVTLGIFADVFSIKNKLQDRNQFVEGVFSGNQVSNIWNNNNGVLWRRVFKEYHIDPFLYPASRIQENWDRIVKKCYPI